MPNWIEGTLKVRGKRENIVKFFKEDVKAYHYGDGGKIIEIENGFEDDDYELYFKVPSDAWLHFDGSRRAFVNDDTYIYLYGAEDSQKMVAVVNFRQAWGFNEDDWIELSKKYGVDLRLYGIECGMMFTDEIEIVNGIVVSSGSEGKCYEDSAEWAWEVPFPYMGG